MKHTLLLFYFWLVGACMASAQPLLKRALQYVPADSVFVLPRGDYNVIMRIMTVAPFASPQPIVATNADRSALRRSGAAAKTDTPLMEQTVQSAKLLLLTGHSQHAELLDRSYFVHLPAALSDDGILPRSEREAAAQQLLNLTGTIIATDNKRAVYINLFENCVTRIHTKKFRMLLDMLSEYPDGPKVKLRIDGLERRDVPFALHIRVPATGAPDKYYLNGHEIIRPVVRDGYLVIDRKWHNGEEVYFLLNSLP